LKEIGVHGLIVKQLAKHGFEVWDLTNIIQHYVAMDERGEIEQEMTEIEAESEGEEPFKEKTLNALLEYIYLIHLKMAITPSMRDSPEKQCLLLLDLTKMDLMNDELMEFLMNYLEIQALGLNPFNMSLRPVLTYVLHFSEERKMLWRKSETDFQKVNQWIRNRLKGTSICCICREDYKNEDIVAKACTQCYALICNECMEQMVIEKESVVFPCPVCRSDFKYL